MENKKMTTPIVSVVADTEQSPNVCNDSITDFNEDGKSLDDYLEEMQKEFSKQMSPSYLKTVSMSELYDTVFNVQTPLIDGLLQRGTYIFAGSPKVGKSFMMAQLAYHISTGTPLWGYKVRKSTVLYFALEDDYPRLQKRLFQMFGAEGIDNLYFATLDVAGRDQQDMKIHLVRDAEKLIWNFEKSETELWKESPEPLLEKIASTLLSESKVWEGTASELCEILGEDVKPNVLSLRLSINANRLLKDYGIHYKASRTHNGRKLSLMK